jgi:hypothetical protein
MKFKIHSILVLLGLILLGQQSPALARIKGIAGGNPFLENSDFDFSMQIPINWIDDSIRLAAQVRQDASDDAWFIHNPESPDKQSWVRVEFLADAPAESLQELSVYITAKYPNLTWDPYSDKHMNGFRSNDIADPTDPSGIATTGRMVYFMSRRTIVSVSWRRHTQSHGSIDVSRTLDSIDRYAAPPIVKSIEVTPAGTVGPGDRLCYHISVDDLKSSFDSDSLVDFKIAGLSSTWIWDDIVWNDVTGAFDICLKLPRSLIGASSLAIQRMSIENKRGGSVRCDLLLTLSTPALQCAQQHDVLPVKVPEVVNSSPDLSPPKFKTLTVEEAGDQLILRGQVEDESKIAGGWLLLKQIPGRQEKIFIAPWQFSGGKLELKLSPFFGSGTIRVSEVILSDEHGNTSQLLPCDSVNANRNSSAKSASCDSMNYAQCTQSDHSQRDASCTGTDLPIVEYFVRPTR